MLGRLSWIVCSLGLTCPVEEWIFRRFYARFCSKVAETTSHIFFSCSMTRDIYRKISTWWDFWLLEVSSFEEWRIWLSNIHLQGLRKEVLEGVFYIIWWLVWNFRNKLIFGLSSPLKATLFNDLVDCSFSWCSYICKQNVS